MQSLRLKNVKICDRNTILGLARLYGLSVTVETSSLVLTKQLGRQTRSEAEPGPGPEFAVPGVPTLKVPAKDSHKKQRKYGPIPGTSDGGGAGPSSSSVTTRQQHNSQVRNR